MNVSSSNAPVSVASISSRTTFRIFAILLLACLGVGQAAFAVPDKHPCLGLRSLDLKEALMSEPVFSDDVLAIAVPDTGWLALQAETIWTASRRGVWLEVMDSPCDLDSNRITGVGSFLDHGLVEVRGPGTVYLRVGAIEEDASIADPEFRLSAHLFPASDQAPLRKEGESGSDTEEDDDEVLPLQSPGGHCVSKAVSASGHNPESLSKEGESGSDTEEDDDEVLPFQSPGGGCVTHTYAADPRNRNPWSKKGESGSDTEEDDDEVLPLVSPDGQNSFQCKNTEAMNNFRVCAAQVDLTRQIVGRIDSGWDRDYFTFTLDQLEQISLIGNGKTPVVGTLLDSHGRKLVTHGRYEDGFILNATLAEGRYYLRVEGLGEGEYRVNLLE